VVTLNSLDWPCVQCPPKRARVETLTGRSIQIFSFVAGESRLRVHSQIRRLRARSMARITYTISQIISCGIFSAVSHRRVLNPEFSRLEGPCILASNHISHFDPLLITSVIRRQIDWMAMSDLFKPRLLGWWLRRSDCFPVQRFKADRVALKTAIDRLRSGKLVGMFPEGGLRDGEASVLGGAELRRGIRAVADLGQAPIIPCVVLGSDRLYCASNWLPLRRTPIWIGFGQPLFSQSGDALEERLGAGLRALATRMREHFSLSDDDFPKPPRDRMNGK
jgi:1-acyl-sn-glycerol-3-phosphate acyltransferase